MNAPPGFTSNASIPNPSYLTPEAFSAMMAVGNRPSALPSTQPSSQQNSFPMPYGVSGYAQPPGMMMGVAGATNMGPTNPGATAVPDMGVFGFQPNFAFPTPPSAPSPQQFMGMPQMMMNPSGYSPLLPSPGGFGGGGPTDAQASSPMYPYPFANTTMAPFDPYNNSFPQMSNNMGSSTPTVSPYPTTLTTPAPSPTTTATPAFSSASLRDAFAPVSQGQLDTPTGPVLNKEPVKVKPEMPDPQIFPTPVSTPSVAAWLEKTGGTVTPHPAFLQTPFGTATSSATFPSPFPSVTPFGPPPPPVSPFGIAPAVNQWPMPIATVVPTPLPPSRALPEGSPTMDLEPVALFTTTSQPLITRPQPVVAGSKAVVAPSAAVVSPPKSKHTKLSKEQLKGLIKTWPTLDGAARKQYRETLPKYFEDEKFVKLLEASEAAYIKNKFVQLVAQQPLLTDSAVPSQAQLKFAELSNFLSEAVDVGGVGHLPSKPSRAPAKPLSEFVNHRCLAQRMNDAAGEMGVFKIDPEAVSFMAELVVQRTWNLLGELGRLADCRVDAYGEWTEKVYLDKTQNHENGDGAEDKNASVEKENSVEVAETENADESQEPEKRGARKATEAGLSSELEQANKRMKRLESRTQRAADSMLLAQQAALNQARSDLNLSKVAVSNVSPLEQSLLEKITVLQEEHQKFLSSGDRMAAQLIQQKLARLEQNLEAERERARVEAETNNQPTPVGNGDGESDEESEDGSRDGGNAGSAPQQGNECSGVSEKRILPIVSIIKSDLRAHVQDNPLPEAPWLNHLFALDCFDPQSIQLCRTLFNQPSS